MALPTATLRAYWDVREWETTMFTGVGSGAPSINASIRQWVSTVGSFSLTSPSDATRPQLISGSIGGQPALDFDIASAEGFSLSTGLSGLLGGTGGSATFFYVIQLDSINGAEGTELQFDGVGFFKVFINATSGVRVETTNGSTQYLAAGKTLDTPLIISVRIAPAVGVRVGVNGTEGNNASLSGTWTYNDNANLMPRSGYAELDGKVAAILVYNSRLDDTDYASAIAALNAEFLTPQVVGPDVTTSDPTYVAPLDDITALVRWVDYIPVQAVEVDEDKIGTYENDGALYTQRLDDLTGKVAWVDYIPVYITEDAASGRWRTDNDGWIPVTEA